MGAAYTCRLSRYLRTRFKLPLRQPAFMTSIRMARLTSLALLALLVSAWTLLSPHVQAATPAKAHKARPFPAKKAVRGKAVTAAPAASSPTQADLASWCKTISPRLTGLPLNQCMNSDLQPGDGRSVRGIALWSRDVLPTSGDASLRVLVLGGIHGDEMASVNLVFDWLQRSRQSNAEPIHWRMVPLANPDGLLRKPSTRTNARGVDLNRNFPTTDWVSDAQSYWVSSTRKDPRRYPGPTAMSEPETRWLQGQIETFKPNLIVSIHAPYGLLDFDGPPPPPNKLGSLYLEQVGIYPGSLGNYGGVVQQVPVVTVELKNARHVSTQETKAMWTDLLGWIDRRLMTRGAELPADLVEDVSSGAKPSLQAAD